MTSPSDFYDALVNTHDFTGYTNGSSFVSMTGSVRDYFYDNSNHIFDPSFDIVGPVDVNLSCTYPQSTANSDQLFHAVLAAADPLVDFSKYDSDHDGYVDMVFFLVAGFSASYGGNNENYLWPHMYYLYYAPPRDGKRFGLYACSTEFSGWEGYGPRYYDIGGIGTFCHEFGHVLGLPDLYDTDYSGSGGESNDPGEWDVMAEARVLGDDHRVDESIVEAMQEQMLEAMIAAEDAAGSSGTASDSNAYDDGKKGGRT